MTLFYDRFDTPIGPLTVAADMLAAQEKLQIHLASGLLNPEVRGYSLWRHAIQTQAGELKRCAALLARTTAANDGASAPSAA